MIYLYFFLINDSHYSRAPTDWNLEPVLIRDWTLNINSTWWASDTSRATLAVELQQYITWNMLKRTLVDPLFILASRQYSDTWYQARYKNTRTRLYIVRTYASLSSANRRYVVVTAPFTFERNEWRVGESYGISARQSPGWVQLVERPYRSIRSYCWKEAILLPETLMMLQGSFCCNWPDAGTTTPVFYFLSTRHKEQIDLPFHLYLFVQSWLRFLRVFGKEPMLCFAPDVRGAELSLFPWGRVLTRT